MHATGREIAALFETKTTQARQFNGFLVHMDGTGQPEAPQATALGFKLGKLGFPKFKTKRRGLGSFRLTGAIHVYEKAIELPRLGRLRLKECGYLPTSGVHILSATVSEEAGRWYVSVQVEEDVSDPPAATGEPIGVDVRSEERRVGK